MAQETQAEALYQPRGWDGEGDGREVQNGGVMCIPMADSCWGLTENNTTPPKKEMEGGLYYSIMKLFSVFLCKESLKN